MTTRKRRGWGEGSVFQRKSGPKKGEWVAQIERGYKNGRRQRKSFTGKRRADVVQKRNNFLANPTLGQSGTRISVGAKRETTVQELGNAWIGSRRMSARLSTLERQESILRCHVYPSIGQTPISKVVEEDILDIMESAGDKLAPRTVSHILVTTRAMFNYGVRRQILSTNPTRYIQSPRVPKKKPRRFTTEEIERYLTMASSHKYEAAFMLALVHGMRLGEVLGLRWDSIDFDGGWLTVDGNLVKSETGEYVIAEPKTHRSSRPISMNEKTLGALSRRRAAQNQDRLAMGSDWHDNGLVFTDSAGFPLSKSNFTRTHHYAVIKSAGVQRLTFHDLRGCFATMGVSVNAHPKTMQELMGHSSITTTMDIYSDVLTATQRKTADDISAAMGL